MKVLWFEVTMPSRYENQGLVIGGWQDSLEKVVRKCPSIDLTIAFEGNDEQQKTKVIDGVTYIPIILKYTKKEQKHWDWNIYAQRVFDEAKQIIENIQPDIIHIFGTEWPFGLVAEYTDIPIVIHIQGSIVFYNNSVPPGYSIWDEMIYLKCWKHPKRLRNVWRKYKLSESRSLMERKIWDTVHYYMGRTYWDKAMSAIMHPGRKYYHVNEALRDEFLNTKCSWRIPSMGKIRLISTGCSTFWKGPDLLIKTASILKDLKVDFEWVVAGKMDESVKKFVEYKEKLTYSQCNIHLVGFVQPTELINYLCSSTIYVSTSYVENSPNSICEAQYLGVPVIATNVGGVASIVRNGVDGLLVPANDPWQMAYSILTLAKDTQRMLEFSKNAREFAKQRHDPEQIAQDLLDCYNDITHNDYEYHS